MYTVIRNYKAAPTLADALKSRSKDVEALLTTVPGFMGYYLVKTSDGATSITVCENKAGCEESTKRAGDWLRQNLPELKIAAPEIIAGELIFKLSTSKTTV